MNKHVYSIAAVLLLLLQAAPSWAQYTTAIPDGNISDSEYDGHKMTTADGGTWYMTWNATNLYIAKSGGASYEPSYVYLDLDPTLPVTGGDNSNGTTIGNADYGVTPTLPFRADVRVYFTNSYIEIRRRTVSGGWSDPILTNLYVSSKGADREISLNWAILTGASTPAIPPAFNWLGYSSNQDSGSSNFRYDQTPASPNSKGTTGGATPPVEYYYTVASTANGSSTDPFLLKSYTFPGTGNNDSFGSIEVWDFTMNTPNQRISRGTTRGNWLISGSLVVGAGTVFFGNSSQASDFGTTTLGNIRVTGGILSMNATDKPINVREDVDLRGGQFVLSGREGGDLNVGRNFLVTNGVSSPGTFQPSGRAVTFTGNGVNHIIQSTQAALGYVIPFNYLTLNTPSGTVTLNNSIFVINEVTFTNGNIVTGSNYVDLDGNGKLNPEQSSSHLIGQVRITQALAGSGSGTKAFGNIGLSLMPQNASSGSGNVTVTRTTGTALNGVGGGSGKSVQRYFSVAGPSLGAANFDALLQLGYRLDELNGIPENKLAVYASATGTAPYTALTIPPSANTSNQTISVNLRTLTSGTSFTFGDGVTPLPVSLISFSATPTAQGTALLRWATASELNNKGFSIERQFGGVSAWQAVGYVAATGQTTGSTYEFTDKSLASVAMSAPLAYYRLRQEDQDGKATYSPAVAVARKTQTLASELILSPVPVTGSQPLSVTLAEVGQAGLEVAVTNTQGQRLLHFTTEASSQASLSLPVEQLAAGVYIVSVRVPGQSLRHARFVKL
jgi:hypothetical protein